MAAPRKSTVQVEETAEDVIEQQFGDAQLSQPEVVNPMVDEEPRRQPSLQALGFQQPEVVVGEVKQAPRPAGMRTLVIRVNEDITDMTITSGGKIRKYNFTAGHRYEVPVDVAIELDRIDKLWH